MKPIQKTAVFIAKLWRLLKGMTSRRPKNMPNGREPSLIASPHDDRDHVYTIGALDQTKIDMTSYVDEVKNQGPIGSCGSHAIISAYEIMVRMYQPEKWIQLSEQSHYYQVREAMGTLPQDSGQTLRDGLKIALHYGLVPEAFNPYNPLKYNEPARMTGWGRFWKIKEYRRVWSITDLKDAVLEGYPVILGHAFWDDFEANNTGMLDQKPDNFNPGGHATVVIGYDRLTGWFKILNSWGIHWGNKGYTYISEPVLRAVFWEAWVIDI